MATICDALRGISAYPISLHAIERVAEMRGLTLGDNFSAEVGRTATYNLAEADLYDWLSEAPNISIGGQYYAITDAERKLWIAKAQRIRTEWGEEAKSKSVVYGYKGSKL